jgi:hypothetical protein
MHAYNIHTHTHTQTNKYIHTHTHTHTHTHRYADRVKAIGKAPAGARVPPPLVFGNKLEASMNQDMSFDDDAASIKSARVTRKSLMPTGKNIPQYLFLVTPKYLFLVTPNYLFPATCPSNFL